jgi:hypothetical protein
MVNASGNHLRNNLTETIILMENGKIKPVFSEIALIQCQLTF